MGTLSRETAQQFLRKEKRFKFENRVTFGKGQRMTLTFDPYVDSLDHFVQCIYQATVRS